MTACALVTEENAEPGEGATFCAIWPALPILSVCSPPTSSASGSPLMLPMMMRPPTSLRRRRLLCRSQEAVCEGGGEHQADFAPRQHRRCQRSPGDSRPRIASLRACTATKQASGCPCRCCSGRTPAPCYRAPACRPRTGAGYGRASVQPSARRNRRRACRWPEVHRVTSPDGPLQRGWGPARWDLRWPWPPTMRLLNGTEQPACRRPVHALEEAP